MVPPKHMAQMMSHIVLIMPAMPRVEISSASMSLSDGSVVLPYTVFITALKSDASTSFSTPCCHIQPAPTAIRVDRNSVMAGGVRRAMSTPVSRGTRSSHGVMTNRSRRASEKALALCALSV